jgi:glucose 1-dehydrogenase
MGIGRMTALHFAREGASVAVNFARHADEAEETERIIREQCGTTGGGKVLLIQADVSNDKDVERMFDEVLKTFGGIDVLVNNAGIQIESESDTLSPELFDRVLGINLRGAFLCAQAAIRHFLTSSGGAIVNVSSVHEEIPKPGYLGYSVSKGGMHNLTRTLALEYARRNIRVNAVGPGATITPMNNSWANDAEKRAVVESHIPMGRAGTAEEMAAAIAFLASDEASYITGQTLYVDGGLTLYPDFRTAWSSGG